MALIVVVLLAALGGVAGLHYIRTFEDRHASETFTVYRATRDFEPGEKIMDMDRDVEPMELPLSLAHSYENALDRMSLESQLGVPLRQPVREREIVTWEAFIEPVGLDDREDDRAARLKAALAGKDVIWDLDENPVGLPDPENGSLVLRLVLADGDIVAAWRSQSTGDADELARLLQPAVEAAKQAGFAVFKGDLTPDEEGRVLLGFARLCLRTTF